MLQIQLLKFSNDPNFSQILLAGQSFKLILPAFTAPRVRGGGRESPNCGQSTEKYYIKEMDTSIAMKLKKVKLQPPTTSRLPHCFQFPVASSSLNFFLHGLRICTYSVYITHNSVIKLHENSVGLEKCLMCN